jgi:hypothetical protein
MRTRLWLLAGTAIVAATAANGQTNGCSALPSGTQLKKALIAARAAENSGLNAQQWATVVDRNGIVCAVAYTGLDATTQAGFARISSAMKANTANAFSFDANSSSNGAGFTPGMALSSSSIYSATQPGGFVAGLTNSFPVNQAAAFSKKVDLYGSDADPMIGQPVGGFVGLAGGLGLFGPGQVAMGGIGVAGDHPCTDHDIAWRTRNLLNLDHLVGFPPVSGDAARPDNIVYDIKPNPAGGIGVSASGLGHPACPNVGDQTKLPPARN